MENEKAIYKPEEAETFVRRLAFVDWFAGVGGFRRGLELAGAECVGFCEFDKYAYCSYVAMHCMTEEERESLKPLTLKARQKEILNNDIYLHGEWFAKDVRAVEPYDVPDADLWTFGFPCQDISIAGKQRGIVAGETRSGLFYEIARLLEGREEKDRPQWLLVENVKNILNINGGADFLDVLNTLASLGYDLEWNLHNSKNYGVPQNRERVYIVGHLRGRGRGKIFPLGRADGENPAKLIQITDGAGQAQRVYDPRGLSRTLAALRGGQGAKTGFYAIDMSFKDSKITDSIRCITATYSKGPGNYGAFRSGVLVGDKIRRLTPRECFRLQGWSDEYFERARMVNSDAQLYIQAGNGVTVSVVQAIGERMAQIGKEI